MRPSFRPMKTERDFGYDDEQDYDLDEDDFEDPELDEPEAELAAPDPHEHPF